MNNKIKVKVNLNLDSYSIMETEFEGRPSRNEIISRIRIILSLYKLPETEMNLDILGSYIITLKKKYGIPEMDILKHMCENKEEGVSLKMQAVISTIYLKKYSNPK